MRRTLLFTTAAAFLLGAAPAALADNAAGTAASPAGSAAADTAATASDEGSLLALEGMLGREVTGSDGNTLGRVSDVILDAETERAKVAVIETEEAGKSIAVDYTLLDVAEDRITARTVTRDQVAEMPAFDYDDSMISLGRKGEAAPAQ
ncbi:PRC-barrel domain-containing protein [Azospirillum halopraeferens]|uniref:PRC-barrel domain-containing protein n=1 Tax=Azospirillum halopraeferens TaxID=34010 RepID=UPI00041ACEA8|nr:PRC-barrel domain-containing protein [Azospirillum halopraeferens]